jgi:hypothetical protein
MRYTGVADPHWSNVSLLLHFDGGFTDSSSFAHSMTTTAAMLSSTAKFGTDSGDFRSASDLAAPTGTEFEFGAGQFTLEAWVYATSLPNNSPVMGQYIGGDWAFLIWIDTANFNFFWTVDGSSPVETYSPWVPSLNTWYHIAVDRDASSVIRLYVNGSVMTSYGAGPTITDSFHVSTHDLRIGSADAGPTFIWPGYIDEVRITKGVARYGGAFTPPSAPFPDHG